jgi:hypothetical protein
VRQLLKDSPDALATSHPIRLVVKPPLPKKDDIPLMGVKSDKDYVTSNAVDAILSVARNPAIQEKDYLKKSDYGQIPKYMMKIRKDIEEEKEVQLKLEQEERDRDKSRRRLLTDTERADILHALRAKWNRINGEYQQITHMTVLDTLGKVRRKESFESELNQVEKDIDLLQRKEDIWIDLER